MCIHLLPCHGERQHSGVDFITHPNHPYTWNPLKYTRPIRFLPIEIDWTVGSTPNLWAMDEGVRDMGLTPNLLYGLIQCFSSYLP